MPDGSLHCVAVSGIVPIRREPNERAEMVSQILLGETAQVQSIEKNWIEIQCDFDGYEGWVSKNQMLFLSLQDYEKWIKNAWLQRSVYRSFNLISEREARLVPPNALVEIRKNEVSFPEFTGKPRFLPQELKQGNLLETALEFLGTPYLWGGRTDSGIDCSGFMQTVYLLHDVVVPRDSGEQFKAGPIKSTRIQDAAPGDAVYFAFDGGHVTHVGFYLGGGTLLHASGSVTLHNIDPKKRFENKYPLNEMLAKAVAGIQSPFCTIEAPQITEIDHEQTLLSEKKPHA